MWRANYYLMVDDEMATIKWGPHLFRRLDSADAPDLLRGYSFGPGELCTGCYRLKVYFNQTTQQSFITRFSVVNFNGLTSAKECADPGNLLPNAYKQMSSETRDISDWDLRRVPVSILTREADEILLVKVTAASMERPVPEQEEQYSDASATVVERIKNAQPYRTGTSVALTAVASDALPSDDATTGFLPGKEYLIYFRRPFPNESPRLFIQIAIPVSPEILAVARQAVATDSSTGEPLSVTDFSWP